MRSILAVLFCASLAVGNHPLRAQDPAFDLIELSLPVADLWYAYPTDIDEFGNVIGYYRILGSDFDVGFRYDRQSATFTYALQGQMWTDANNWGGIVGGDQTIASIYSWIWTPKDSLIVGSQAMYWSDSTAAPVALAPVDGDEWTAAGAINDLGLIVGVSYPEFAGEPAATTAVVWQVTAEGVGAPYSLPSLPGDLFCVACGISEPNSNGLCTIVGRSGDELFGESETLVRWRIKIKNNGTLALTEGPVAIAPTVNFDAWGEADAVNSQAFAVGRFDGDAFRVNRNGNFRFLKTFKVNGIAAHSSYAGDVNESKDIVGYIQFPGLYGELAGYRGALWRGGKTVVNLSDEVLLPNQHHVGGAIAINESGEIAAFIGKKRNFWTNRPVILVPR